jgi:hypothetical protein
MKRYLALLALFVATASFATTGSIQKSKSPGSNGWAGYVSQASISLGYNDFPSGTHTYTITSVSWQWSQYNNGGTTAKVELCYSLPGSGTVGNCQDITSTQSGSTLNFNSLPFGPLSGFYFRHTLTGGTYPAAAPLTPDAITVNYSY